MRFSYIPRPEGTRFGPQSVTTLFPLDPRAFGTEPDILSLQILPKCLWLGLSTDVSTLPPHSPPVWCCFRIFFTYGFSAASEVGELLPPKVSGLAPLRRFLRCFTIALRSIWLSLPSFPPLEGVFAFSCTHFLSVMFTDVRD